MKPIATSLKKDKKTWLCWAFFFSHIESNLISKSKFGIKVLSIKERWKFATKTQTNEMKSRNCDLEKKCSLQSEREFIRLEAEKKCLIFKLLMLKKKSKNILMCQKTSDFLVNNHLPGTQCHWSVSSSGPTYLCRPPRLSAPPAASLR